LQDPD
jgi:hypothetical protein